MKHTITLIPGDGVGPEVIEATRRVLEATGVEFQFVTVVDALSVTDKHREADVDGVAKEDTSHRFGNNSTYPHHLDN